MSAATPRGGRASARARCRPRWPVGGLLVVALAGPLLVGCRGSGQDELQEWLTQQRAQPRPVLPAVAPPRGWQPQSYEGAALPDPFSVQKLTQVLQRESALSASSAMVLPERRRRRQPLEDIPLESMAMVGSLAGPGGRVALVRIGQEVHTVPPGAYLGQNFGKVLRVSENQVVLREIVQEASGEWVERAATLQLQEGKK